MKIMIGVDVAGLRPEIILALMIAEKVYEKHNEPELILSCGREGKHMRKSLHYVGLAADISLPKMTTINSLVNRLGKQYDVVIHLSHIHIEFQPKVQL